MTLLLAPVNYGVCHRYVFDLTAAPLPVTPNTSLLMSVFAKVGQWVMPLLCLIAAAISYVSAQRRKALLDQVRHNHMDAALVNLSWLGPRSYLPAGLRL